MAESEGHNNIPSFNWKGKSVFLDISSENVSPYVILAVRDPLCLERDPTVELAKHFDKLIAESETTLFKTITGKYKNVPVTVCSTGSGAPDTELALMEFIMTCPGVNTFIRLGASGAFQRDIGIGEFVISTGAVRDEGCSKEYISGYYPAMANYEVLLCQIEAFERKGIPYRVGVTRSLDTMYPGLGRPSYKEYLQKEHEEKIEYWSKANVLNIERESSIILTLTTLFGLRGGSNCIIVDNYFTGEIVHRQLLQKRFDEGIEATLETFVLLHELDELKRDSKKRYFYPSLWMVSKE
jgi:uridine phosphorylase